MHALKLMGLDAAAEDILSRIAGPHPKIKDTLPTKVQVCIIWNTSHSGVSHA